VPIFQYPKEDQDFLASITRTFMRHINDIRITLQHLTVADAVLSEWLFRPRARRCDTNRPIAAGKALQSDLAPLPCSMRSSMRSESMSDTLCDEEIIGSLQRREQRRRARAVMPHGNPGSD